MSTATKKKKEKNPVLNNQTGILLTKNEIKASIRKAQNEK